MSIPRFCVSLPRRLMVYAVWMGLVAVTSISCSREERGEPAQMPRTPTDLVAEGGQLRMPPGGRTSAAAYLVIRNSTSRDYVITNVSTPVAGGAEVHRHIYEDGMHKMRPASHVRVSAGGNLKFEPGGYHVMLFDLNEPLTPGESIILTFEFDDGSELQADVFVKSLP